MSEKVTVYNLDTGQRIQLWPIDARELVARGGWSLAVPSPPAPAELQTEDNAPEPLAQSSGRGRRAGRGRATK